MNCPHCHLAMRVVAGVDVCVRCGNAPDETQPHGELTIDREGNAHFECHTPGTVEFKGLRVAIEKWIALLQDQIAREDECPLKPLTYTCVHGVDVRAAYSCLRCAA
jgi:hypothetical protein